MANKIGTITDEQFGAFLKYIKDPDITDIDFNGRDLWVRNVNNTRYKVNEPELTDSFIRNFAQRVADVVSEPFNKVNNVLEAETDELRITCVHETVAISGTCVCIRKTTSTPRITYKSAIEGNYTSKKILNLLINCIKAEMTFTICGEPGVGKTEFGKFLSLYIPDSDKVVTIEDTPEWHYAELKPDADSIQLKMNEFFDYIKALKTCLRLNTYRIMMSEVRSVEVVHLIELWTIGASGITTLHTNDVRKIPDRILNMMPLLDAERLENSVYSCLDVGILIKTKKNEKGEEYRYLDQMCFFDRIGHENICYPMVFDGELVENEIPENKLLKFKNAYIKNPFEIGKTE